MQSSKPWEHLNSPATRKKVERVLRHGPALLLHSHILSPDAYNSDPKMNPIARAEMLAGQQRSPRGVNVHRVVKVDSDGTVRFRIVPGQHLGSILAAIVSVLLAYFSMARYTETDVEVTTRPGLGDLFDTAGVACNNYYVKEVRLDGFQAPWDYTTTVALGMAGVPGDWPPVDFFDFMGSGFDLQQFYVKNASRFDFRGVSVADQGSVSPSRLAAGGSWSWSNTSYCHISKPICLCFMNNMTYLTVDLPHFFFTYEYRSSSFPTWSNKHLLDHLPWIWQNFVFPLFRGFTFECTETMTRAAATPDEYLNSVIAFIIALVSLAFSIGLLGYYWFRGTKSPPYSEHIVSISI